MGISAGASALSNLFGKQKNPYMDPKYLEKYREDMTMSDEELTQMRNVGMAQLTRAGASANMANAAQIKQAAAVGRMPSGAALSNLAGANYQTARGIGESGAALEGNLRAQQMQGNEAFAQLMAGAEGNYMTGQAMADNQNAQMWGGTIGNLGKIALLWQSGFFSPAGGAGTPQNLSGAPGQAGIRQPYGIPAQEMRGLRGTLPQGRGGYNANLG